MNRVEELARRCAVAAAKDVHLSDPFAYAERHWMSYEDSAMAQIRLETLPPLKETEAIPKPNMTKDEEKAFLNEAEPVMAAQYSRGDNHPSESLTRATCLALAVATYRSGLRAAGHVEAIVRAANVYTDYVLNGTMPR